MDRKRQDLTDQVEQAWRAFRARLADRLVAMQPDDVLLLEIAGVADDEDGGAAPYVQFLAGDELLRTEAVSNVYLDDRFQLGDAAEQHLLDLGFRPPLLDEDGAPAGWDANFHLDVPRVQADRAAVAAVEPCVRCTAACTRSSCRRTVWSAGPVTRRRTLPRLLRSSQWCARTTATTC